MCTIFLNVGYDVNYQKKKLEVCYAWAQTSRRWKEVIY